jgi:hypothetical protein
MDPTKEISFKIDSFTPATLPMARLAEYLSSLAALYGSESEVHFKSVRKGSAILVATIEEPALPKVFHRLRSVSSKEPNIEAKKAYGAIDKLLRNDNAIGSVSQVGKGKLLEFPGRLNSIPEPISIIQATTVDGMVIKIGGKDDTIPVTIRDQEGRIVKCQIRGEAQAKELSKYYLSGQVRFHGSGKWIRYPNGSWEIDSMTIQSYEVLDTTPLDEVLAELAAVEGNGWKSMDQPLVAWRKLRGLG